MKKVFNSLLMVAFTGIIMIAATAGKAQAQDVTVSYQNFYDELSPYGQWVYDADYGNVWVPNEDAEFRPYYSRGHWVMTDYGNTWLSDDPWGWACYHYGRWTYNGYYGWIWVPGYEWAPAWVSWRYGGGYAGWAPLSPGISVGASYGCPDSWWVFVGPQYLYTPNYYNYWRGAGYNRTYINQTTIINNVYVDNHTHVQYNYGPRASTIQATTHAPVQVYRVAQGNRPGTSSVQRNTVSIYRPNVNRNTYATARPANVIQAPRNVGRPEAAVAAQGGNRQPAFRQELQRNPNGNTGVVGPRGNQPQPSRGNSVQQGPSRFDNRSNPAQQPMRQQEPQRSEPQRQEPQRSNPQPQRSEPQRQEPQRNNPQPQTSRPEPQRFNPEPQRQEPQRQEPQRFEPQRNNPQPQQPQRAPEQPRPQPQPQRAPEQPRPQPQMQQPRPQPAPAPAPAPRNNPQPQQEQRGGRR